MRAGRKRDEAASPILGALVVVAGSLAVVGAIMLHVGAAEGKPLSTFPDVVLVDAEAPITASSGGAALAYFEHRGGDRILWGDVTLTVQRPGAPAEGVSALAFSATPDCSYATPTLEGTFEAGDRVFICARSTGWSHGDTLVLRVVGTPTSRVLTEQVVQLG